jgi:putative ABC transport system ATP-binding protein
MRITGAAACAKTTEQKSAAASAVNERMTDRNEDDEFMSTCHCRGAFRGAQRTVAEYNAPPPDRSARHFRVALSTCGACVDHAAAPTVFEASRRSFFLIMTEPVIRAQDLSKIVQSGDAPLTILDGVSFEVGAGATVAIVGASGSGKTTLLGLLAGLDRPTAGEVWLGDTALNGLSEDARAALRRRWLGFVFQSFQLLPALTALENVMLPLELAGAGDAAGRAREWLARVGLSARLSHYPKQLSGGEQQRVAIARAFCGEPQVLMADEPTGNLDGATGAEVADVMFRLNRERGTTLLLVTHDAELASRCARRLSLAGGKLIGDDAVRESP